ncbi:SDR family oxidoreductase [Flavisphingomonas formosensis]|uniref:SDR family oxidoreductase n=1 Tax=Flavisphingomonas formosensis TaxID=861534 RepID=UPI0012FCFBA9|nr:SDR family oxidoreductase [Sphingomonas formosensis]
MSAKDKVVIVTGGARNMGFHCAAGLVRRGAKVAIIARGEEALAEAKRKLGSDVLTIAAQLSERTQIEDAIAQVADHFGGIDGIVNNAGVAYPNRVESLDPDQVLEQTAINLLAPIFACRAIIPHLRARGGGRIVNVSSATVHVEGAFSFLSIYGATKAGLERFTDELRYEVQRDNIAVTSFIPGDTSTGFGTGWDPDVVQEAYADWMERGPYWNGMMPVEAVGEEIAHIFDLPSNVTYEFMMLRPVGRSGKVLEGG